MAEDAPFIMRRNVRTTAQFCVCGKVEEKKASSVLGNEKIIPFTVGICNLVII